MHDGFILLAALVCSGLGLAWLALAMDVHWQQVFGPRPQSRRTVVILRGLAVLALAGSLALCLRADRASIAALVWPMSLAAAALVVIFTLSWRPRCLAPLAGWTRAPERQAEPGS